MKKKMLKLYVRPLILMLMLTLAIMIAACGKNNALEDSGSINSSQVQQPAGAEQQNPVDDKPAGNAAKTPAKASQPASSNAGGESEKIEEEQAPQEGGNGGVLENEGELEIIVPEGEETFGE